MAPAFTMARAIGQLHHSALRKHRLLGLMRDNPESVLINGFSIRRTNCHSKASWQAWDHHERSRFLQQLLSREWLLPSAGSPLHRIRLSDGSGRLQHCGADEPSSNGPGEEEGEGEGEVWVIRDDLLHPLLGGNKLRKLDALLPALQAHGVTDVVTCGGLQSAHTAAVAAACAERGMAAHLLLRGERPAVPTGYALLCALLGRVAFVPRSVYAQRAAMLQAHSEEVAGQGGAVLGLRDLRLEGPRGAAPTAAAPGRRVAVVPEGAGDVLALPGLVRLVQHLAGEGRALLRCCVVVDAGTGTTAVGLALGIALLGLPWRVQAVMLAGTPEEYGRHQVHLLDAFWERYGPAEGKSPGGRPQLPLEWVPRQRPRKFGNILDGEVEACRRVARETGILLDPIYTLAGWELACTLARGGGAQAEDGHPGQWGGREGEGEGGRPWEGQGGQQGDGRRGKDLMDAPLPRAVPHQQGAREGEITGRGENGAGKEVGASLGEEQGGQFVEQRCCFTGKGERIMLLHTGGTLGLFGLAQRYPSQF